MKSIKVIVTILIVVGLLAVVKYYFLTPHDGTPTQGAPGKMNSATPVNVYVAENEALNNEVFATGTLMANEIVSLMPEISGKIVTLNISEGNMVSKGALLVKINDADYQAQLKKLELQKKINEDKVGRMKQLLAINGISQEEYDISLNTFNTTNADIEFVKAQIAKTEIRAPFNGTLGLRNISEGSYVNPSTVITTIQQLNPLKMDFSVPEKYAGILNKNDAISFTIDGNSKTFKARVYAIQPNVDQATRTITLRALAENNAGDLFPGAFAKVALPLHKIDNAIMIPTEAIIPILKGKKVFVCRDGKAQEVKVETGIRTDAKVQIISGINAGDSVITTGIMQLKAGMNLKIVNKAK